MAPSTFLSPGTIFHLRHRSRTGQRIQKLQEENDDLYHRDNHATNAGLNIKKNSRFKIIENL